MDNERSATILIGGKEYELVLTTRATKEIGKRYGGLSKLGDSILSAENLEAALDEIVWLIELLANQGIQIHNLMNPDDKKPLLTAEVIELLTNPSEIAEYKDAIMTAMVKGTKREIISEDDEGKNPHVGLKTQRSLPG